MMVYLFFPITVWKKHQFFRYLYRFEWHFSRRHFFFDWRNICFTFHPDSSRLMKIRKINDRMIGLLVLLLQSEFLQKLQQQLDQHHLLLVRWNMLQYVDLYRFSVFMLHVSQYSEHLATRALPSHMVRKFSIQEIVEMIKLVPGLLQSERR